ncbi:hypothetical protein D3C76_1159720 [compost metagenome]
MLVDAVGNGWLQGEADQGGLLDELLAGPVAKIQSQPEVAIERQARRPALIELLAVVGGGRGEPADDGIDVPLGGIVQIVGHIPVEQLPAQGKVAPLQVAQASGIHQLHSGILGPGGHAGGGEPEIIGAGFVQIEAGALGGGAQQGGQWQQQQRSFHQGPSPINPEDRPPRQVPDVSGKEGEDPRHRQYRWHFGC